MNIETDRFTQLAAQIAALEIQLAHELEKEFVGKKVRVTSTKWNGQKYGRSRKPLTGRVFEIWWAHCTKSHGIYFQLKERDDVIQLSQCEVLP